MIDNRLSDKLIDDFSRQVLYGGLRVAKDVGNPIRMNLFALAVRELSRYTLHKLAPDGEVENCTWFKPDRNAKGPTRRQRAKYATQGGLSDSFVAKAGVDVRPLHNELIKSIEELSKYTHVEPRVIVREEAEIERFVEKALSALDGFFLSVQRCRESVLRAVEQQIDWTIVNTFIHNSVGEIDELATHHRVDEVNMENLKITALDDKLVKFEVRGFLGVEMQWGSNSDVRRGDGEMFGRDFPFVATMSGPVENVTSFFDLKYTVDTQNW